MEVAQSVPDQSRFHRSPARYCKISDIDPLKDIRVRFLGKVVDKQAGLIVLDDGSTQVEIVLDQEFVDCIALGDQLRVFARVLPLENGFELRAELVQDFNSVDAALYKKIFLNALS
jgi:hypothetical protein